MRQPTRETGALDARKRRPDRGRARARRQGRRAETVNPFEQSTARLRREVDSGARVHEWFYNDLSELVGETHPDFGSIGYVLDANGNRTQRTINGVTEYLGYDAQNKLLWLNQAGNYAPTANQAQPYRLYTYDAAGQPVQMEHRDAGQGVTRDRVPSGRSTGTG